MTQCYSFSLRGSQCMAGLSPRISSINHSFQMRLQKLEKDKEVRKSCSCRRRHVIHLSNGYCDNPYTFNLHIVICSIAFSRKRHKNGPGIKATGQLYEVPTSAANKRQLYDWEAKPGLATMLLSLSVINVCLLLLLLLLFLHIFNFCNLVHRYT